MLSMMRPIEKWRDAHAVMDGVRPADPGRPKWPQCWPKGHPNRTDGGATENRSDASGPTPREQKVLDIIDAHGSVTSSMVVEVAGMDLSTACYLLARLNQRGLIHEVGMVLTSNQRTRARVWARKLTAELPAEPANDDVELPIRARKEA